MDDGLTLVSFSVSVSLAQTAGRGWTQRSQSSLHALHCSILPKGSPTASASVAATLPVLVNLLTRLRPPQLATSLVRNCTEHASLKAAKFHSESMSLNMLFFWSVDIPSAPGKVVPTRNTDTSVVVSWEASHDAKELIGYYIEGSIVGSNVWEPCNNKPVHATR